MAAYFGHTRLQGPPFRQRPKLTPDSPNCETGAAQSHDGVDRTGFLRGFCGPHELENITGEFRPAVFFQADAGPLPRSKDGGRPATGAGTDLLLHRCIQTLA
ncbi:hypothetical protein ACIRG4_34625 [Streptomyces sp. NPDC102395]|uniref:hypothetical protein n=1 Tax=Streptomyces sp. NPDC102395 TaxID=3366168 RepID=UPI003809677B